MKKDKRKPQLKSEYTLTIFSKLKSEYTCNYGEYIKPLNRQRELQLALKSPVAVATPLSLKKKKKQPVGF